MDSSIGWLGGIMLAVCGAPQAVASYRQGHSRGVDLTFLLAWFVGEVLLLAHVQNTYGINLLSAPLWVNYVLNIVLVGIILRYKLWERT